MPQLAMRLSVRGTRTILRLPTEWLSIIDVFKVQGGMPVLKEFCVLTAALAASACGSNRLDLARIEGQSSQIEITPLPTGYLATDYYVSIRSTATSKKTDDIYYPCRESVVRGFFFDRERTLIIAATPDNPNKDSPVVIPLYSASSVNGFRDCKVVYPIRYVMPQFNPAPRELIQISGVQLSTWKDQEKVSSLVGEIANQAQVYLSANPGGLAVAAGVTGFVDSPLGRNLSQRWNSAASGKISYSSPLVVIGPVVKVGPAVATYDIAVQPIDSNGQDDGQKVPVGTLILNVDYVASVISASGDPVDFDNDISPNSKIVVIGEAGTPKSVRIIELLNTGENQNAVSSVVGLAVGTDRDTVSNTCSRLTGVANAKAGLNRYDSAAYVYWAYLQSPLFRSGSKLADGSFAPCLDLQQLQFAYNRKALRAAQLGPEPAKQGIAQAAVSSVKRGNVPKVTIASSR